MDMLKILFEPNKFFGEENEQESGIKMPFLIVLLNGIVWMATTFLVMDVTLPIMGLEGVLPAMKNAIQMARGDPVLMETLMMEAMQGDPIAILSSVIGIVFTVWGVYIWIFAIQYARGVSLKNSMIIVGVPSTIYVIYLMHGLIGII